MKPIEIQNLDQHLRPLQVDGVSTGLELSTDGLRISAGDLNTNNLISQTSKISGDLTVDGKIYLTGSDSDIQFANNVMLDATSTDDIVTIQCKGMLLDATTSYTNEICKLNLSADSGYDTGVTFMEATTQVWTIGNDASDSSQFKINSGATLSDTSDFQLDNAGNTRQEGSISIKEKASAIADTDTYGQIWVKNEDPEELCFTDGGGTDIVGIGKYHYDTKVTNFYATVTANFLPLAGGTKETTSMLGQNENVAMVAPYNGTLERAVFRSEIAQNGDLIFAIHESSDGTEAPGISATGSKTTAINIADDTAQVVDFDSMTSGANTITKGRIYAIKLTAPSAPNDTNVTLVFKWDITS